jgi:superoxide dismutase, Cu-Zn family
MNAILHRIQRILMTSALCALMWFYGSAANGAIALPLSLPLAQVPTAQATLTDPSGTSSLGGQISISEAPDGVKVEATITGAPAGYHGFHIHQNASCADNGDAAGGHYNPDGVKHGYLPQDGFESAHAGDLGNILIYANGTGVYQQTIPGLTLTEGKYGVTNHAVIVHANRDDFGQPTGNAGGRIGCGILTLGNPG